MSLLQDGGGSQAEPLVQSEPLSDTAVPEAKVEDTPVAGVTPTPDDERQRREQLFEIAVLAAQDKQLNLIAQAAKLPRKPDLELIAYQNKENAKDLEKKLLKYSTVPIQVTKAASLGGVIGQTISQKGTLTVNLTNGITFGTKLSTSGAKEVAKNLIKSVNPWIVSVGALALDLAVAYHQWRKHRNNLRLLRDMLESVARHGTCIAGATLGALLGTMIFPGIGTILGGIIGGICTPLLVSKCISMIESKDSVWSNEKHYEVAPPLIVFHNSLDFLDIPRSDNPPRWLIEHKRSLKLMESHPDLTADLAESRRLKLLNTFIKTNQAYEMIKEYLESQRLWEKKYNVRTRTPSRTPSQATPSITPHQSIHLARSRNTSEREASSPTATPDNHPRAGDIETPDVPGG